MGEHVNSRAPHLTLLDQLWYNDLAIPGSARPATSQQWTWENGGLNLNLERSCQPRARLPEGTRAL